MEPLRAISLNANGLLHAPKRRAIFSMIRNGSYDFAFLQETHSTAKTEHLWRSEWGGRMLCSHGSSNSRGVITLLPKNSDVQILNQFNDTNGRVLILQIMKNESTYVIANVHTPTQDHPEDQIDLIDQIEEEITKMDPQDIIVGGDLNLCMDKNLDRAAHNQRAHQSDNERYKARIQALEESLHLVDLWRTLHPTTKHFSFRRANSASRLDYWLTSEHLLGPKATSAITPYPLSDHAAIMSRLEQHLLLRVQDYGEWIIRYYKMRISRKQYRTFSQQNSTTQKV